MVLARATSATLPDPLLNEAVARIVHKFEPKRIVLFGSRAWGTPAADSDYDLLVLVDDPAPPGKLAGAMCWELLDVRASFDIIVRPSAWWKEVCDLPFSLERRIERQGKELYVAA